MSGTKDKVHSSYIFNADGSGAFETNGQKMYDLTWEAEDGNVLAITYALDQGQPWKVKLRWSVNTNHTLLTLVPQGDKDARGQIYGTGPGVYHKK